MGGRLRFDDFPESPVPLDRLRNGARDANIDRREGEKSQRES